MKYIKTFEDSNNTPEIGDYVAMSNNEKDLNFINYTGKIRKFFTIGKKRQAVMVSYGNNIPDNMKEILGTDKKYGYYKNFQYKEIFAFSKNKEDLKIKIITNKFNL